MSELVSIAVDEVERILKDGGISNPRLTRYWLEDHHLARDLSGNEVIRRIACFEGVAAIQDLFEFNFSGKIALDCFVKPKE